MSNSLGRKGTLYFNLPANSCSVPREKKSGDDIDNLLRVLVGHTTEILYDIFQIRVTHDNTTGNLKQTQTPSDRYTVALVYLFIFVKAFFDFSLAVFNFKAAFAILNSIGRKGTL